MCTLPQGLRLIAKRPEEVVDSLGWAEAQRETFARINLREREREHHLFDAEIYYS